MCIITLHLRDHPIYQLILLANRDEFYVRPTKPVHFWENGILAGRDLQANGTWLGITRQGRFAALTNFRDPTDTQKNKCSRGEIVTTFLNSDKPAPIFLEALRKNRGSYQGFNLIAGTVNELWFYSKQDNTIIPLEHGTYSVSNASLNTPWPKVEKARRELRHYVLEHQRLDLDMLFRQLHDGEIAKDEHLPNTGLDLAMERLVSPIFVTSEYYGTRSSTILLVTHDNIVSLTERTFQKGTIVNEVAHEFNIL